MAEFAGAFPATPTEPFTELLAGVPLPPAGLRTQETQTRTKFGRLLARLSGGRRLASLILIVAAWQIAAGADWLDARTLPAPAEVATVLAKMASSGVLEHHLTVSLLRVATGATVGVSAGLLLGIISGLFRFGEDVVDAPLQALRMLPHLALVPLLILWFGVGETSKAALVALGSFFAVYVNVFAGIRNVDVRLVEAGRVFGLGHLRLLREVILPGALPSALVGLRQSLGVACLSLVVAEQINAKSGIGYLMMDAREFQRTDVVVLGLLVYAALGLTTDLLVRLLEGRVLGWRRGFVGA